MWVVEPVEFDGFQRFGLKRNIQHAPATSHLGIMGQENCNVIPRVV
jgi:hypothetical protein